MSKGQTCRDNRSDKDPVSGLKMLSPPVEAFVSFAYRDAAEVCRTIGTLLSEQRVVVHTYRNPEQEFPLASHVPSELKQLILDSDWLILLLTPCAWESPWVALELDFALQAKKQVFVLRIGERGARESFDSASGIGFLDMQRCKVLTEFLRDNVACEINEATWSSLRNGLKRIFCVSNQAWRNALEDGTDEAWLHDKAVEELCQRRQKSYQPIALRRLFDNLTSWIKAVREEDWSEAAEIVKCVERAVDELFESPRPYFVGLIQANTLFLSGNAEQSLLRFQHLQHDEASVLDPHAFVGAGFIHAQRGEFPAAWQMYREAYQRDPNDSEVLHQLLVCTFMLHQDPEPSWTDAFIRHEGDVGKWTQGCVATQRCRLGLLLLIFNHLNDVPKTGQVLRAIQHLGPMKPDEFLNLLAVIESIEGPFVAIAVLTSQPEYKCGDPRFRLAEARLFARTRQWDRAHTAYAELVNRKLLGNEEFCDQQLKLTAWWDWMQLAEGRTDMPDDKRSAMISEMAKEVLCCVDESEFGFCEMRTAVRAVALLLLGRAEDAAKRWPDWPNLDVAAMQSWHTRKLV